MNEFIRCDWAKGPLYEKYHDEEWGRPLHNDRALFELLLLEGQQAGLSWLTVLTRRDKLRQAFDNFDPAALVNYDDVKIASLLQNKDIIRNRLKVQAAVVNARVYFKLKDKYESLDNFLWRFVDYKPLQNTWEDLSQVPAKTLLSDHIGKEMKALGFKFVGSTIIYAYMQAMGMVNDHLVQCHCHRKCSELADA